jgi:adenosine kinase
VRIAVTGSIATDHLMTFPGKFSEQLMAEHLEKVSLSFLVDDLEVRRGGVAANIAFGMGVLGQTPILVGAVGTDFAEYDTWLKAHGVDTDSVKVSETKHTARFVCTTDTVQAQLASFYPGAMSEAGEIKLAPIAERTGAFDFVVIAPNDPGAMVGHTAECRDRGYPFVADPSQQLAWADGDMVRALVDGAAYLFTNDYEAELLMQKSGWSKDEVLSKVGKWVITRGADGSTIETAGEPTITVSAAKPQQIADPTGVGDAFRAGYLTGLAWGFSDHDSAQLGSAVATLALEVVGPQEYSLEPADLVTRVRDGFGDEFADAVAAKLP